MKLYCLHWLTQSWKCYGMMECYNNANHWSCRRQILSIMASKDNFKDLQSWIPNLSRHRFNIAIHHLLLHGRGTNVQFVKGTRMYIAPEKLDHFLSFITGTHIIQDLPFGEKALKLSSNTEIKVPNVVRCLIPKHIVLQYLSYCSDGGLRTQWTASARYWKFSVYVPHPWGNLCKVWTVFQLPAPKLLTNQKKWLTNLEIIMEKVSRGRRCRRRNFI